MARKTKLQVSDTASARPGASGLPALLKDHLESIAKLGTDWDGYGAAAVTPWAVGVARDILDGVLGRSLVLLNDVFVTPSVDGGVRLEWVTEAGRELTVIVPPNSTGMFEFYRATETPAFEEDVERNDYALLSDLLDWLIDGG